MRVRLVCNAASGGATDGGEITQALEQRGATVGDARPDRIVVAGGDGTVGEAAALAAELGVPLAVIPTGTANDFAKAHDLPTELDEAVALAVDGEPGPGHELARIDGRPFLNVAAAGLAPAAARRGAPFKRFIGPLAYPFGALLAGLLDDPIPCRAGTHFDGRAWQVIVACSGAFGGGSEIDAADPADGLLDLLVIPDGRRAGLALRAARMWRGDLADDPAVVHVRVAELTLTVPAGTAFNVDGELVEAGPEVRFTVRPAAFRLITNGRRSVQ